MHSRGADTGLGASNGGNPWTRGESGHKTELVGWSLTGADFARGLEPTLEQIHFWILGLEQTHSLEPILE